MSDAEVVIIGGGIIGLSIARSLTIRGVTDVLVLERATLGSGGTGKSSGIVRCHYGVPSLAAMAWHSLPYFGAAAEDTGFRQVGYVVGVGPENEAALRANTAMHQDLGIDVDMVQLELVERLWPHANLADFAAFSYEPRGGYADASQTAFAFWREARAAGAQLRQRVPVVELSCAGDRITGVVLADGSTVTARVVIVAAGAWSAALLAPLGVDFPVRSERAELLLVDAGEPLRDLPVLSDLVSLQYVRIEGSGELLVGSSDHSAPEYADPDDYSNRASAAGLEKAAAKVLYRFAKFGDPRVTSTYAGTYDVTPDYNPVIAPVGPTGLFLAAGFSGHGFKISPAVGALIADLVLDGDSREPLVPATDFRLSRFADGHPLTSEHSYLGAGEMR
jgi:sarcosine oxidase, subunit beta